MYSRVFRTDIKGVLYELITDNKTLPIKVSALELNTFMESAPYKQEGHHDFINMDFLSDEEGLNKIVKIGGNGTLIGCEVLKVSKAEILRLIGYEENEGGL